MKYHFFEDKLGDNQLAGKIGVHPFFLKQYKQASKFYSKSKLAQNLSYLRHYDLMSKGVFSQTTSTDEILKEMIFKDGCGLSRLNLCSANALNELLLYELERKLSEKE